MEIYSVELEGCVEVNFGSVVVGQEQTLESQEGVIDIPT